MSRRKFIKLLGLGSIMGLSGSLKACAPTTTTEKDPHPTTTPQKPIVIATWYHGLAANKEAWTILEKGGNALDAVEKGVMVTESDIKNTTVGIGGTPDRDGHVTLDACIMDEKGRCGAVAFLEHIEHPIQVARLIMEKTPHVMLVGDGALQFAVEQGIQKTNLLTEEAKKNWAKWKKTSNYETPINIENHDTISMLAIDQQGNISGACTTSGMAYKMHGRVGDSPIIGAGLFVDNEVGAAAATGVGELVMRTLGSFLVVEFMRQGMAPEAACKAAVDRIVSKHDSVDQMQVGFIALNKNGEYGGYSIHKGFDYAVTHKDFHEMQKANHLMK